MTDKEMIEEMAKFIPNDIVRYDGMPRGQHLYIEQKEEIAKELLEAGYRKIPEGSVVLSREEYAKDFCSQFNKGYERGSKNTARKFVVNFENDIDKLDTIIYEETLENYVSVNAVLELVAELAKQFGVEVEG